MFKSYLKMQNEACWTLIRDFSLTTGSSFHLSTLKKGLADNPEDLYPGERRVKICKPRHLGAQKYHHWNLYNGEKWTQLQLRLHPTLLQPLLSQKLRLLIGKIKE